MMYLTCWAMIPAVGFVFDGIIGTNEIKATRYMIVEITSNTIHGYSVSEKRFKKLTICLEILIMEKMYWIFMLILIMIKVKLY